MSRYELMLDVQKVLDSPALSKDFKMDALEYKMPEINKDWDPTAFIVSHALSAYHIDDELTLDSFMTPFREFGEVIVKGTVPRITCIKTDEGSMLLTMPFQRPVVLGPRIELELGLIDLEMEATGADITLPLDIPMHRPIHVPVKSLVFTAFSN